MMDIPCFTEDRYAKTAARRRFDAQVRRDQRAELPRGDALLALYASKTAEEIAREYGFRSPWMVFRRIREARS